MSVEQEIRMNQYPAIIYPTYYTSAMVVVQTSRKLCAFFLLVLTVLEGFRLLHTVLREGYSVFSDDSQPLSLLRRDIIIILIK